MNTILKKLTEKSTIVTLLTLVAGALSWKLDVAQSDTIASAVIVILGLVGVVTPEAKKE